LQWIKSIKADPFFMYINMQSSHSPYHISEKHKRKFSFKKIDFPFWFGFFPKENLQDVKNLYSESLYYIDIQLGKLFDLLKSENLWNETYIVLLGDNGNAFYEHGQVDHAAGLYEEMVRTPVLIKSTESKASDIKFVVQHIDIVPSILADLGYPKIFAFQGENIFSKEFNSNRSIFLVVHTLATENYAVVKDKYKLIYNPLSSKFLLFNLDLDPAETHDLSIENTEVFNDLKERLFYWMNNQIKYFDNPADHLKYYPPQYLNL
jgi:arylsulfatase A-like enzyme